MKTGTKREDYSLLEIYVCCQSLDCGKTLLWVRLAVLHIS